MSSLSIRLQVKYLKQVAVLPGLLIMMLWGPRLVLSTVLRARSKKERKLCIQSLSTRSMLLTLVLKVSWLYSLELLDKSLRK